MGRESISHSHGWFVSHGPSHDTISFELPQVLAKSLTVTGKLTMPDDTQRAVQKPWAGTPVGCMLRVSPKINMDIPVERVCRTSRHLS